MSDWFHNESSEIPDELWRASTPMQRQADAVVLWAELTGKHASKPLWEQEGVKGWAQEDALMGAIRDETNPAKKAKLVQKLRGLENSNLEKEYGIKSASFDGMKAFGQTLMLNPRSDDLEKAFKHYEKKTGNSRNQMSQRDIYNSLRATGKHASAGPNRLSQADLSGARPLSSAPPQTRARLMMLKKHFGPKATYSRDRSTGVVYKLASGYARSAAVGATIGGLTGAGTAAATSKKDRKKKTLRGAAAGAAVGAATGVAGRRIRAMMAKDIAKKAKPGPKPGTIIVPANALRRLQRVSTATGGATLGGGIVAGRVAGKKKSTEKKAAYNERAAKAIRAAAAKPELVGATVGAPVGGLKAYLENRKGKGGVSQNEASAIGEIAKAKARKEDKKTLTARKKELESAREKKKNLGREVLKGTAVGAGAGALFGFGHKKMRERRKLLEARARAGR